MTCQDCKWLEKAKQYEKSPYVGRCVGINRPIAKEYDERIRALLCKDFKPTHESVGTVLDALNNLIDKIKEDIKAELDKDSYGYDIITEQGIRTGLLSALAIIDNITEWLMDNPIDDSWESISK